MAAGATTSAVIDRRIVVPLGVVSVVTTGMSIGIGLLPGPVAYLALAALV